MKVRTIMVTTTTQPKAFLKHAINNAVAQQRFEGLTTSQAVISDLERFAEGQLSIDDVIKNIGKRYQNDRQILNR